MINMSNKKSLNLVDAINIRLQVFSENSHHHSYVYNVSFPTTLNPLVSTSLKSYLCQHH